MGDQDQGHTLGWPRLALRLAASRLGLLAASMLTALVAATLLVTESVLAPAVAEQSFRGTVDAVPPSDNDLRASTAFGADTWADVDQAVHEVTARHQEIVDEVTTAAWTVASKDRDQSDERRLSLGTVAEVESHAELADGRWALPGADPLEVAVHAAALDLLGLEVGDTFTVDLFAGRAEAVQAVVVGSFLPRDPEHPLWRGMGHGSQQADNDSAIVAGPVLATPEDLLERIRPGSTTAAWTVSVDLAEITLETAPAAIRSTNQLRADLAEVPTQDPATQVSVSGGTDVLEHARSAAESARAVLLVIVTMVTVLAGWSLAFTARLLAAGRAAATALVRARGGTERTVARLSLLSAAVPALIVAVTVPLATMLALRLLRDRDLVAVTGGTATMWLLGALAAAAWLAMLVVADLRSGRSVASVAAEAARPSRRAAAQRAGIDIVVLAIGLLALQQLRRPAGETADAVLIVAPAALVLSGTLVVVRLLPWCSRAVSFLAARTRGLSAVLGSVEVARRPLRHVAAVAMLALALAAAWRP